MEASDRYNPVRETQSAQVQSLRLHFSGDEFSHFLLLEDVIYNR